MISWNCRELGNQRAVNALTFLVKEKVPNVLFLIETKQSVEEMKHIQNDLHYPSMFRVRAEVVD